MLFSKSNFNSFMSQKRLNRAKPVRSDTETAFKELADLKKVFCGSSLLNKSMLANIPLDNGVKSDCWAEIGVEEDEEKLFYEKDETEDAEAEETVEIPDCNRILTDWFTMSSKNYNEYELRKILKMENVPFEREFGNKFYRDRWSYQGVNIFFNPKNAKNGLTMLEMSGKGCRTFEQYGTWHSLFKFSQKPGNSLTRADIAYDDVSGLLDVWTIYFFTFLGWFVSPKKSFDTRLSDKGICVYFGTRKSETLVRFYDKSAEQGLSPDKHWVRCEIVLRRGSAKNFISNPLKLGDKFAGVLNNFICFVEPKSDTWDSNVRRWKTQEQWKKFVNTTVKISVYSKGEPNYTFERFKKTAIQYSNIFNAVRLCIGDIQFLRFMERFLPRMKLHQRNVVDEFLRGVGRRQNGGSFHPTG